MAFGIDRLKLLNFDLENIWPKMMRLMIDDTQNAA